MDTLEGQDCPVCHEKALTLMEAEESLEGVGKVFVFGMKCDGCELENGDIELDKPAAKKQEYNIKNKKHLDAKVARGSQATIKIPEIKCKLTANMGCKGYVGTVNDIINEFITIIKSEKDSEEDKKKRKKLFNQIDQLLDVQEGKMDVTLAIEDKTGNTVIIS